MTDKPMTALFITELGRKTALREVPRPELADDQGVLVRVSCSGVSVGTELWIASGKREHPDVPFVNGYQASGHVVETGAAVESVAVGDPVAAFCSGAHAQYVVSSEDFVVRLPGEACLKPACLFVMPSVAANALNMAGVNTGDTVYVVGQGLIGQCTAMLARLRGAYVIASDIAPARMETSRKHCADLVVDASGDRPASAQIRERFADGVDVVIESTGFQQLLDDALLCCRAGGRFVFEGYYPGSITYSYWSPHAKQVTAFYPSFIGPRPVRESVIRLLASKTLDLDPLISHLTPWRDAVAVYDDLFTEKRNTYNGIVFDWTA